MVRPEGTWTDEHGVTKQGPLPAGAEWGAGPTSYNPSHNVPLFEPRMVLPIPVRKVAWEDLDVSYDFKFGKWLEWSKPKELFSEFLSKPIRLRPGFEFLLRSNDDT